MGGCHGNVNSKKINEISKKLRNVEYNKINTKITGIDGFPDRNHATIIYLSLDSDVIPLFNKIMELFEIKNRFFVPHITLYRLKKWVKIKDLNLNYNIIIDSVCLYESIYDKKRKYNPLYCVELK